jgi:hypothetical protein
MRYDMRTEKKVIIEEWIQGNLPNPSYSHLLAKELANYLLVSAPA